MEIYISQQCLFFFLSIFFGAMAGVLFDVFRIVRIAVKHPSFLVAIEDFSYCLFIAVNYIIFIFCANHGIARWFSFFGVGFGFFIYLLTIGRIVMKFSELIINFIKSILIFLRSKIVMPILNFFARIFKFIIKRFIFLIKVLRKKRKLYRCKRYEKALIHRAANGFIS